MAISATDLPSTGELHPRQKALVEAVRHAGNTGVFVAGPVNTAFAQDLSKRGMIRLEVLPGRQSQPAFMALPAIASDPAGYSFDRVVAVAREWAMLRWHFNDAALIAECVKRSIENRESVSPREVMDRLAIRFGLEDPHDGNAPKDVAVRGEVAARGAGIDEEWLEARARNAAPVVETKTRRPSAAERARAQLIRRS
ncbi:MAG: hypothetical protein EBR45_01430 [Betaproteobacteria bacterium]|nr:hypothetical protein [Betaproteobacteria bacterium]